MQVVGAVSLLFHGQEMVGWCSVHVTSDDGAAVGCFLPDEEQTKRVRRAGMHILRRHMRLTHEYDSTDELLMAVMARWAEGEREYRIGKPVMLYLPSEGELKYETQRLYNAMLMRPYPEPNPISDCVGGRDILVAIYEGVCNMRMAAGEPCRSCPFGSQLWDDEAKVRASQAAFLDDLLVHPYWLHGTDANHGPNFLLQRQCLNCGACFVPVRLVPRDGDVVRQDCPVCGSHHTVPTGSVVVQPIVTHEQEQAVTREALAAMSDHISATLEDFAAEAEADAKLVFDTPKLFEVRLEGVAEEDFVYLLNAHSAFEAKARALVVFSGLASWVEAKVRGGSVMLDDWDEAERGSEEKLSSEPAFDRAAAMGRLAAAIAKGEFNHGTPPTPVWWVSMLWKDLMQGDEA